LKIAFEKIFWGYAFLLVGLAYVFGLFIDLTGDSGLYAAITRQMVDSGDWLNLKINGEPYDQKPHLLFWLAGLGVQLFGNTNFAFKLFPFMYGACGIYFIYRLGRQVFSENAGKWAALISGTSQIYFLYFFDFHTDSILQTGVVLALWQLAAYLQNKKPKNFVFGFFGIGLAMLSKGPVGAVLLFFTVLLYLVLQKDFRQLFHPKWILGILISMLVVSPTLFHLYRSFGTEGLKFFFFTNNFGRITGEYAGSSTDYFYYLYNALWAFHPWTVFVVFALYSEIKSWFSINVKEVWGISVLGSIIIFTIVLSIAKGKAPNYFLLAIPAISVVAGKWMEILKNKITGKNKILFATHRVLLAFLIILIFTMVIKFSGENFWLALLIIISGSLFFFLGLKIIPKYNFKNLLLQTVIIIGSLNLFMNANVLPVLFKYQGARQVLQIFESENTTVKNYIILNWKSMNCFLWQMNR
jgi:4-amino-4-deoxy-L-arabinose transferase-like glycosyltransferase